MTPLRKFFYNHPNAKPDPGIHMRNGRPCQAPRKPAHALTVVKATAAKPEPEPLWQASRSKTIIRRIIARVCAEWNIDLIEMLSHRRPQALTVPRQVAIALAFKLTPLSSVQLGRHFGRDHSTILHARNMMAAHIAAVAKELGPEPAIQDWIRALKARLEA